MLIEYYNLHSIIFFFKETAPPKTYPLSLPDPLPFARSAAQRTEVLHCAVAPEHRMRRGVSRRPVPGYLTGIVQVHRAARAAGVIRPRGPEILHLPGGPEERMPLSGGGHAAACHLSHIVDGVRPAAAPAQRTDVDRKSNV